MPQAPMAQRQVTDAPAPGVRVSAAPTSDTYGGQIGDTVSHAAVRMYDLQTRSSDHAAVLEAETRANEEQLRIQQDVLGMRGKEASNAPQYAQESWQKVHQDILGSLANDRQRTMYHQIGTAKGEIINRGALSHFNHEDERYQQETYKANLSSSVNVARMNAESPTAVAFEKDVQTMKVNEHAAKYGYAGTPQHAAALTEVHSATNKEVINGLIDKGQDLRAKAYYDQLMKQEKAEPGALQFTAADRDSVDKALLEGSTRGESRRIVQDLITTKGIATTEQRRAVLAEIDKIKDPKVADMAKSRMEHEFAGFDRLKAEQYTERFLGAWKIIEDKAKQNPMVQVRDLIPASLWNSIQPSDQNTLELHHKRMINPEKPHDPETWFKFEGLTTTQLAATSPQELMGKYLGRFDQTHFDRALAQWSAARNVQEKGEKSEKFVSALSDKEMIRNTAEVSGLFKNPKKLTPDEYVWHQRFETEANLALATLSKKDATAEDKQKILDGLSDRLLKQRYTVDPGMFSFNKEVPAIAMSDVKDPRSIKIPLKDIPAARQDVLKRALKAANLPITNANMEELEAKDRLKRGGVR